MNVFGGDVYTTAVIFMLMLMGFLKVRTSITPLAVWRKHMLVLYSLKRHHGGFRVRELATLFVSVCMP